MLRNVWKDDVMRSVFAATLLLMVGCNAGTSRRETEILRLDSRINHLIPQGAVLEKIADGFTWLEGPAWNSKGQYLLFSDIPANAVYMWKEGKGTSLFLKPSGYSGSTPFTGKEPGSNGLIFDAEGRLVLCEHGDRRISRIVQDGSKETIVDRFEGKRLNSPNDVVFASNGDMYFTDPPFGLPGTFTDPVKELDFQGVYRYSVNGTLMLLTKNIKAPNGIAFSPDGNTLYVTDVDENRSAWLAYDVAGDGGLSNERIFFDATEFKKRWPGGPDGMKVDTRGNIFGAGPGGVHVFSSDGTHLGSIITGVATSNCVWGDDGSTLYITASTAVYRIKTKTKGAGFE